MRFARLNTAFALRCLCVSITDFATARRCGVGVREHPSSNLIALFILKYAWKERELQDSSTSAVGKGRNSRSLPDAVVCTSPSGTSNSCRLALECAAEETARRPGSVQIPCRPRRNRLISMGILRIRRLASGEDPEEISARSLNTRRHSFLSIGCLSSLSISRSNQPMRVSSLPACFFSLPGADLPIQLQKNLPEGLSH